MIQLLVPFTWICGYTIAGAVTLHTTAVINGACYTLVFWESQEAKMAFGIWFFLSFYVIMVFIFIFCYGRILATMHRQATVIAAHGGSNTSQTQLKQIQTKIIKTMLLVALLFVVTYTPGFVFTLLLYVYSKFTIREVGFHIIVVLGSLYTCVNPFIYATNFDPVKNVLVRLLPWKRSMHPESFELS